MKKFNTNVSNENLLTESPCIPQVFVSTSKLHARNTCYIDSLWKWEHVCKSVSLHKELKHWTQQCCDTALTSFHLKLLLYSTHQSFLYMYVSC